MSKKILNPKNAQENLDQLLKDVNTEYTEVHIISEQNDNNAVLVSLDTWKAIQETGVLGKVKNRENDDSESTDMDTIDWTSL